MNKNITMGKVSIITWIQLRAFWAVGLISFQPPFSTVQPNECQSESEEDNALGLWAFHYFFLLTFYLQALGYVCDRQVCLFTNSFTPGHSECTYIVTHAMCKLTYNKALVIFCIALYEAHINLVWQEAYKQKTRTHKAIHDAHFNTDLTSNIC